MLSAVLAGCGGGGGDGTPAAAGGGGDGNNSGNPPRLQTLTTGTLTAEQRTGTAEDNVFTITGDMTDRTLTIDGAGGTNSFVLASGDVVRDIVVSAENPAAGDVHLQNIERIELRGGTVRNITGTRGFEKFLITGDLTSNDLNITGIIDGGGYGDNFILDIGGVVRDIAFTAGDAAAGDVHLQNIKRIELRGGTVRNITGATDLFLDEFEIFNIAIAGDLTSDDLNITGIIADGADQGGFLSSFSLGIRGLFPDTPDTPGVVRDIAFTAGDAAMGDVHLQDIWTINLIAGTVRNITASTELIFDFAIAIRGDLTSNDLNITGIIDGGKANYNRLTLEEGGVVNNIAFSASPPAAGDLHLQNIVNIFISDGTVRGNVTGSRGPDRIHISGGDLTSDNLNINGIIDGGRGNDEFWLSSRGSRGGAVNNIVFSASPPAKGDVHLQNIERIRILNNVTVNGNIDASSATAGVVFTLTSGTVSGNVVGSPYDDIFVYSSFTYLTINGIIDGGAGDDAFLPGHPTNEVNNIAFSAENPAAGDVHLQNIEHITIGGIGTVNGTVDASGATAGVEFDLDQGSTVTGNVVGSPHDDTFNLHSTFRIGGYLDGGDGTDSLRYAGASGTTFTARSGLATDGNTNDGGGSVRNIERQEADATITSLGAGGGLRGLTVRGIEVLGLSPALNLYGALSDALMQFGQQTAQGFALADLNLATGRATQLVSKDSPFSKGRIWAHKITHSGNGKGSIGLGLTGLTARADNDYDYEMSLTQHGFDAPLATTKLGAFNLRAVSHTMTGVIETNVAQAKVSGYGAGLAMMWNNETLSAHITSLAGAYEVEATTSSLNPRAVVSEVSEGSFSAVNAVVSAGIADKRELANGLSLRTSADISWQTLSLDDFNETGPDGIAINFDKATRFTARVGAGLESEHWFSDVVFVHETSSGGTLSSGLSQDYRQDDGTAIEMKLGGKIADLATGLTLKAHIGLRTSFIGAASIEPSGHLALNWRF